MQFFHDLGSLVEQRWSDKDYCEEVFPELAEQALKEAVPYRRIDPWDVIRWLNTTDCLPEQRDVDGIFGDPPITVFNGPRFYIDVYYWLDGTTSIHQHAFSGAFQVLLGSSILSQYKFKEKREINAHFKAGEITLDWVELLEEGDVRQILPGRNYIHGLFHLDRPSATVVVRTYQTPSCLPQYDYHRPYLAINPFYKSPGVIKKMQSTSLLLSAKHPGADDVIGEVLGRADFQTAFSILNVASSLLANDQIEKAFGVPTGKERFESLFEIARRRHGELSDLILPVFEEAQRQNNLIHRRGQITSKEHRFFLALLLNVPNRAKVLDLVRQRFPEQDPVATVTDWVEELAHTRVAGSSEPNVLGIEGFDEDYLFAFQCLLEGQTDDQIRAAFERELPPDEFTALGNKPEELCNAIRNSMLFESIFLDSTSLLSASQLMAI